MFQLMFVSYNHQLGFTVVILADFFARDRLGFTRSDTIPTKKLSMGLLPSYKRFFPHSTGVHNARNVSRWRFSRPPGPLGWPNRPTWLNCPSSRKPWPTTTDHCRRCCSTIWTHNRYAVPPLHMRSADELTWSSSVWMAVEHGFLRLLSFPTLFLMILMVLFYFKKPPS